MAWAWSAASQALHRAAIHATDSRPLIWRVPKRAAFLLLHVARLEACPLGSWQALYVITDILTTGCAGRITNSFSMLDASFGSVDTLT